MKEIKMLVSDLDGTLLNEEKQVSEKTKEVIRATREKGIRFGIASGRPLEPILELVKEWGISSMVDFVIGMNGGVTYDMATKEKEEFYLLDGNIMKEIMDHYNDLDVRFMIFDGITRYVNKSNEETKQKALLFREIEIETDLYALCEKAHNKIIINCEADYMPVVEEHSKSYVNEQCVCFKTAATLFEYVDPRVNKSFGIQKLCDRYGIGMENVIAFGDTSNDNEMLRDAGIGVCMKNGTEDTKAMADYITLSNEEDGIAVYLQQEVL